jgi:hypothetical protein
MVALRAAPAWSQGPQITKGDPGLAGGATTVKTSAQPENKASAKGPQQAGNTTKAPGKDSQRTTEVTKNSSQAENRMSGGGPLANARIEVQQRNGRGGEVSGGDVLTISGDYKVSPDASVTVRDGDGHQATFDKHDARITVTKDGDLKIELTKPPDTNSRSSNGKLNTDGLKVLSSSGIQRADNNHNSNNDSRANSDANFANNNNSNNNGHSRNDRRNFVQQLLRFLPGFGRDEPEDNTTNQQYGATNQQYNDQNGTNNGSNQYNQNTGSNNNGSNQASQYTNNTGNAGTGTATCPGGAIAIAGGTTAVACPRSNTVANNQYSQGTGSGTTTNGQGTGSGTAASNQYNQNTGSGTTTNGQSTGSGTTVGDQYGGSGSDLSSSDMSGSIDNQDPVSDPQGDVIDEVNSDGPLPDTGGPVPGAGGPLPDTGGLPVPALSTLLGVGALMVAWSTVRQLGARRK